MKQKWKWYYFPNLSLTIDLQYIRMLSFPRQTANLWSKHTWTKWLTCQKTYHLPNGILTLHALPPSFHLQELSMFQQCLSLFPALPTWLIIRLGMACKLVSTTGASPWQDCLHITKNNVKSAAFLRNYSPPGTSPSKPAKGCTLLMQVWFWLFVQKFTCTVVTAALGSSAMRSRETDVPVLHPISQHDVANCSSL